MNRRFWNLCVLLLAVSLSILVNPWWILLVIFLEYQE